MRKRTAPGGRRRWIAAGAAALCALVVGLPAAPAKATATSADPGAASLLVRFKPSVATAAAGAALNRAGAEAGEPVGRTGFVEIFTDGRPLDEIRRRLLASGLVETAEPHRQRRATLVPADLYYADYQASYLSVIGFPRAWDTSTGSDALVLAVLDSGVDVDHPDLAGRLLPGRNFVDGVSGYADDEGHGTMVAGVAGARTNNGSGVAGATWRGRILPVKVLDRDGVAQDRDIIEGIDWAVGQGADVINLSLGAPGESTALCQAVARAVAANVVVVTAAGNLSPGEQAEANFPAACPGTIAVGATDKAGGALASFSNTGTPVDLVAPGVDIITTAPRWATQPNPPYTQVSGTSFATPLVAGAALLLRASDPSATAASVAERLRRSARDLGTPGFDARFGAGLLDVGAALRLSSAAGSNGGTATQVRSGYWTVSADGRVYDFGDATLLGDAAGQLQQPAVDLEAAPGGAGYWIVDRHGAVFTFGAASYYGGLTAASLRPGETVTSLSARPGGGGYWLFTTAGRVFRFGSAQLFGDLGAVPLNAPILDSVPTPTGNGYYMVGADGGIFAFGDAVYHGSTGSMRLNAPVQSLVPDPDGTGYWLVASDGGVFAFEAGFRGSMGGTPLNKPVTGMVAFGDGYLMVGEDGGIFNFSNLPFSGSLGGAILTSPVVAVASLPR